MKRLLLALLTLLVIHQVDAQLTITGRITDTDGLTLFGVNVAEKGTSHGTVTDLDGAYSINVANADATLVFSYVGYETKEIKVNGNTTIDVIMNEGINLGEVQVVGTRSYRRSSTETPVAVDVIDIADLSASSGKAEINQILQYAAPSFNATKQSGSDGADHIDPASLRGLGPDQTLVLINGKRRHQSSLVNVFGTRGRGNSGTDLNALPASAIDRIEILRDGSSAQYGSDAIAGVMNIVLKDQTDGLTGGVTYGMYSTSVGDGYEAQAGDVLYNIEGTNRLDSVDKSFDGNTIKLDLNYGLPIGENGGFVNFTTEYLSKERTLRPGWSWRKGYGSAAIDGFNFMVNSAIPLAANTELYAFGGRNFRDTDANAFSRESFADGDNRSVPSLYPNGFTPHITSSITDVSASVGIRHTMNNGWVADFSNTYGKNYFHYYIKGTNNASMKEASPTDFDAGGHSLSQNVTGLDFTKYFEEIASGFNLAYGLEYRTENFEIFSGEVASYAQYDNNGLPITDPVSQQPATDTNGDQLPGGAQGFPGYSPANVVDRGRTNIGLYVDGELNITDPFLVDAALRFENYSDFGSTFNWKIASRYTLSDKLTVRGSFSTGFRAPSLAQIHYNLIFNNFVAGESLPSLLSSNTSTVTRAFGIGPLQEETSVNGSLGFTLTLGAFTATIDGYSISVKDRIILTDNFDASGLGLGVDVAQFFANGVDTKTQGIDIVLGYRKAFNKSVFTASLAGNLNDLTIEKIHNGDLNPFTFFGPFSQAYLEAAAPDYKFSLGLGYSINKFDFGVNLTQFSKVIIQDFQWVDTPATTQAEADALYAVATDTYDAALVMDLTAGYSITDRLKVTIGASNLFNKYPTPQFDGWTDQGGFNDSVQMGSDGAYYFGRIGFRF
ncbi:MAG: TonB-dependent receptor [Saprospiraceae bacterium]|nr:TonB-dependent receptor [Candidatus Opimibacter iunctus]